MSSFLSAVWKKLDTLLLNTYLLSPRFITAVNLGLKMENTVCVIRVLKSQFCCLAHVFGYSVASMYYLKSYSNYPENIFDEHDL